MTESQKVSHKAKLLSLGASGTKWVKDRKTWPAKEKRQGRRRREWSREGEGRMKVKQEELPEARYLSVCGWACACVNIALASSFRSFFSADPCT